MTVTKKLWIGIAVLIILTPLGLILPDYFKAGDAWGEWGSDTIQKLVGYVPQGIEKLSNLWNAPLPDYSFKGWEDKGMATSVLCLHYCRYCRDRGNLGDCVFAWQVFSEK